MKLNIKSLLKDKNVLRIVALLSIFNLLGYLMMQNLDAVAFFIIIGFLTTYFSKNMIIVLLVAMVATNFLVMSRSKGENIIEGMTTDGDANEENSEEKEDAGKDSKLDETEKTPKLDDNKTEAIAHDHLDELVKTHGVDKKAMQDKSKQLLEQSKALKDTMKHLGPAMEQAKGIMEGMGGVDGMQKMLSGLTPMLNMLPGSFGQGLSAGSGKKKKGGEAGVEGFELMM